MATLIHQRVELARKGENPYVICRVPSGWAVLGDTQVLRGYSLLLPDPVPPSLNDMSLDARLVFLRDMTIIGDALLEVTGAFRINYEILGNTDPALHVHIFPRYMTEPEDKRKGPAWFYNFREAPVFDLERDRPLMEELARVIQKRL